jgi:hypothetical protein
MLIEIYKRLERLVSCAILQLAETIVPVQIARVLLQPPGVLRIVKAGKDTCKEPQALF